MILRTFFILFLCCPTTSAFKNIIAPLKKTHLRQPSYLKPFRFVRTNLTIKLYLQNGDSEVDEVDKENFFEKIVKRLKDPVDFSNIGKQLILIGVGIIVGLFVSFSLITSQFESNDFEFGKAITLFSQVLATIEEGYVDNVDVQELLQAALGSMLKTLDPYTEFENKEAAKQLEESVSGRYGGVGLIIAAETEKGKNLKFKNDKVESKPPKAVQVVSAFEGYAFDEGMRPGDRIIAVDGKSVDEMTITEVKDLLRGEPGTAVSIRFIRNSPDSMKNGNVLQEQILHRRIVKISDIKLATLIGSGDQQMGYIQLAGFSASAGRDFAAAYRFLNEAASKGLSGLILDLRGNPGGLLESAVEVASSLVPKNSIIVSAKGRSFGEMTYKSISEPIRDKNTPLIILTDERTASAAEIVSGAVQDLDMGVILGVGKGVTFGKGLVQNIVPLGNSSSLKYTVAKYYTPSGRCIQSVDFGSAEETYIQSQKQHEIPLVPSDNSQYSMATLLSIRNSRIIGENERNIYQTLNGRYVKDGGGIEADLIVEKRKPSLIELALYAENAYYDYAGHWAARHFFSDPTSINWDDAFIEFKKFIIEKQKIKEYDLLDFLSSQLKSVETLLVDDRIKSAANTKLNDLKYTVLSELFNELSTESENIKNSMKSAILSRYLPESMVLRHQLDEDPQFKFALSLLQDALKYHEILQPIN